MKIDAQITFIYTPDLARSAAFYEDALGLELALDQGSCRIYRVIGGSAYIGICQGAGEPEAGAGIILTLATDDVDAWHESLVARGYVPEHAPRHDETYNIYHFFLRDPAGYRIEIQRFAKADWSAMQ